LTTHAQWGLGSLSLEGKKGQISVRLFKLVVEKKKKCLSPKKYSNHKRTVTNGCSMLHIKLMVPSGSATESFPMNGHVIRF
jgi:hypothetical protein